MDHVREQTRRAALPPGVVPHRFVRATPGQRGRSAMRRTGRVLGLGLCALLAGCAAMESAPPERLAELRASAQACGQALPAVTHYDVDRFGRVQVSAHVAEADVVQRNFHDCVARRGRWATWQPGQSAPLLDPPGTEAPDPAPALRVP